MTDPGSYHRTLRRQMGRAGLSGEDLADPRYAELLSRVSSAYEDAEKQRYLHDRPSCSQHRDAAAVRTARGGVAVRGAVQRDRLKAFRHRSHRVDRAEGTALRPQPGGRIRAGLDHDAMLGASLDAVLMPADALDTSIPNSARPSPRAAIGARRTPCC